MSVRDAHRVRSHLRVSCGFYGHPIHPHVGLASACCTQPSDSGAGNALPMHTSRLAYKYRQGWCMLTAVFPSCLTRLSLPFGVLWPFGCCICDQELSHYFQFILFSLTQPSEEPRGCSCTTGAVVAQGAGGQGCDVPAGAAQGDLACSHATGRRGANGGALQRLRNPRLHHPSRRVQIRELRLYGASKHTHDVPSLGPESEESCTD